MTSRPDPEKTLTTLVVAVEAAIIASSWIKNEDLRRDLLRAAVAEYPRLIIMALAEHILLKSRDPEAVGRCFLREAAASLDLYNMTPLTNLLELAKEDLLAASMEAKQ